MRRDEVELLLQSATGGARPKVGETLLFTERGWTFGDVVRPGEEGPPGPPGPGGVWLVVTDPPFNAVGDGTADDTGPIQAAINAAFDAGGGGVFLPIGTYLVSQLRLKSNVWLIGNGWGSILKAVDNNHTLVLSGQSTGANGARTLNDTSSPPFTLNAHKNFTLHLTGGLGSGQKRSVTHAETTSQLAISDDWATVPDATSTYDLLDGKHVLVLDVPATTRQVGLWNFVIDGNKANQIALVDGVYYSNLGWSDPELDSLHVMQNVLIEACSGSGLTRSTAVREMRILQSRINLCDQYGSRNLLDHTDSGASDCKFVDVVASKCGLSGFSCGAGHDLYTNCKAFGNGLGGIVGNGTGFLLFIDGNLLSSCEAQENVSRGFQLLLEAKSCSLVACLADANGEAGVVIDGTTHSYVQVVVRSSPGLAFTTDYAIKYSGAATRNYVVIEAIASQLGIGLIEPTSAFDFDSTIWINNQLFGPLSNRFGVLDAAENTHLEWGKLGAGAATNPRYFVVTTDDLNPRSIWRSAIGGTVRDYMTFDHLENRLRLGMTAGGAPFGEIVIDAPLVYPGVTSVVQLGDGTHRWGQSYFGAEIFNQFGTTNVPRTHFQWGRLNSPATNDPSYYLKTSGDAVPKGLVEGFDGSTTRTFLTLDFAAGTVTVLGLAFSGAVTIRIGTDGSTTDDHIFMGKTGSPAAGNPEYRFRTTSDAVANLLLQGFDGTTTKTLFTINYNVGGVDVGGIFSWGGGGTISSSANVPQRAVNESITGLWTFSNTINAQTVNVNVAGGATGAIRLFAAAVSGQTAATFRVNDESGNAQILIAASGSDPISVRVNSSSKQVTEGATDSGGAGFKVLRVPN